MEKMFNFISVIGGLVGGFIVSLFGGWDVMSVSYTHLRAHET